MGRMLGVTFGVLLASMRIANAQPDKIVIIYQLEEKCGKRAAEIHAAHFPDAADAHNIYDYENHYNTRLNKCFIVETTTTFAKGATIKTIIFSDVNENKGYGTFDPITCEVEGKTCHSLQEWQALIKPYMEE